MDIICTDCGRTDATVRVHTERRQDEARCPDCAVSCEAHARLHVPEAFDVEDQ
jgi:hypothetical protein